MSSRTVYIRHNDPASCVREISARAERVGLEMHPLRRDQPGDRFSKLILGTHNFVRTSGRGAEADRLHVLEHITHTTVIVGVPSADDRKVAAVVEDLDAVVFDGTTVRDSSGEDLLV